MANAVKTATDVRAERQSLADAKNHPMRALLLVVGSMSTLAQTHDSMAENPPAPPSPRSQNLRAIICSAAAVAMERMELPIPNWSRSCGGQVGFFPQHTGGSRSTSSDCPMSPFPRCPTRKLADVLNFMVFRIGGASVPAPRRAVHHCRSRPPCASSRSTRSASSTTGSAWWRC